MNPDVADYYRDVRQGGRNGPTPTFYVVRLFERGRELKAERQLEHRMVLDFHPGLGAELSRMRLNRALRSMAAIARVRDVRVCELRVYPVGSDQATFAWPAAFGDDLEDPR